MFVTELKKNQVFVFGSNEQGFHGAGAAGYAFSGTEANDWRTNPQKQAAITAVRAGKPRYHQDRIGKWAVWGMATGFQCGTEGKSYAIATVERPGGKQVSYGNLYLQVVAFLRFATANTDMEFLVAPIGLGRAGFGQPIIDGLWNEAAREVGGLQDNIKLLWRLQ